VETDLRRLAALALGQLLLERASEIGGRERVRVPPEVAQFVDQSSLGCGDVQVGPDNVRGAVPQFVGVEQHQKRTAVWQVAVGVPEVPVLSPGEPEGSRVQRQS
jgi:hypothetical protein